MSDSIRKQIHLNAPVSQVWRALTNPDEFGQWFRVKFETPFIPGQPATGFITWPGYEHLRWTAVIQKMEAERLFSFTWHPYAIDPNVDYSTEPPTLVEFTLAQVPGGTLLTVVESGFAALPAHRRDEAFRMNDGGWSIQMENIAKHVGSTT